MSDPGTLDLWTAAALGALQGVAEFLPISSSGHLALAQALLGVDPEVAGHRFNIVVHAGTLLAVLLAYRDDLRNLLRELFDEGPQTEQARGTVMALFIGTLPLGIVLLPGVEDVVVGAEGSMFVIGALLCTTAVLLAFTHRRRTPKDETREPPTLQMAALIGLAQLGAVLPGISRSGATIAAGLALGMGRARAARFSFLLSILAIGGASAKEVLEVASAPSTAIEWAPYAVGFVASFVTGFASLRALLRLLERVGLLPFVPYLVVAGATAMYLGW